MNQGSLSLSVRLRHPSMSPSAISASMMVHPDAMHAAGEDRRSPTGRLLEGQYVETYWVYKLDDREDADIGEAIRTANEWMALRAAFLVDFVRSGGSSEYYLTVTANDRMAIELAPSIHASCVKFGTRLSIEIFT